MPVVVDHQHRGKNSRPNDRGASHDIDGDGSVETSETEASLVEGYMQGLSEELAMNGEPWALLATGEYKERHLRARSLCDTWGGITYSGRFPSPSIYGRRTAYLACHINAAERPGTGGMILYDERDGRVGFQLADAICRSVLRAFPEELSEMQAIPCNSDGWDANAYHTIKGIHGHDKRLVGVCLEPCYINQPQHMGILSRSGLLLLGKAIGLGVMEWISDGAR